MFVNTGQAFLRLEHLLGGEGGKRKIKRPKKSDTNFLGRFVYVGILIPVLSLSVVRQALQIEVGDEGLDLLDLSFTIIDVNLR